MDTGSKSVRLRKVEEGDLPIFFEHQCDAEAHRMAGFTPRDHDSFMVHWHKLMGDDTVILRTITFEGQVAGNMVTFLRGNTREIGYWIGKEYWGRGIATEALRKFLRQVKARPLYAGVVRHNLGSIRVLEKSGFALSSEEGEELLMKLE